MGEKITLDIQSFYNLVKTKARSEILTEYVQNVTFVDKEMVNIIMGVKEEKGE